MAVGFEMEMGMVPIMLMCDWNVTELQCDTAAAGTVSCWKGYNSGGTFTTYYFKLADYYQQTLFKYKKNGKTVIEVSMDTSTFGPDTVLKRTEEVNLGAHLHAVKGGYHYPCPEVVLRPLDAVWSTQHETIRRRCKLIIESIDRSRFRNQSVRDIVDRINASLDGTETIEIGTCDAGNSYETLMLGGHGKNRPMAVGRKPSRIKIQATFGIALSRVHVLLLWLTTNSNLFPTRKTKAQSYHVMRDSMIDTMVRFDGNKKKMRLSREHIGQLDGLRLIMECYYLFLKGGVNANDTVTIPKGRVAFLLKTELYRMYHLCLNKNEKTLAGKLYKKLISTKEYKNLSGTLKKLFDRLYEAGLEGERGKDSRLGSGFLDCYDEILPEPVGRTFMRNDHFKWKATSRLEKKRRKAGQWYVVDNRRLVDETTNLEWTTRPSRNQAMVNIKKYANKTATGIARIGPVIELRHMTNCQYNHFLDDGDGRYSVKGMLKIVRGINGLPDGAATPIDKWRKMVEKDDILKDSAERLEDRKRIFEKI